MSVKERADDKSSCASHLFLRTNDQPPHVRAIPWTLEKPADGQVVGAQLDCNFITRSRTDPDLIVHRTAQNIADSSNEYYIGALCISGDFTVKQGGTQTHAKPGDIVIYDSTLPTRVCCGGPTKFVKQDYLGFFIPKEVLASKPLQSASSNILISPTPRSTPLSQCLALMSRTLLTCSRDELSGLLDACTALLPIAAGANPTGAAESWLDPLNPVFKRVLIFVEANLANPELSAIATATTLGVSDRYIHKLFASRGLTFSAYVRAKRLDHAFAELYADRDCQQISQIAYKWGFSDISTFNRAFKKRFGWSPRHCRT